MKKRRQLILLSVLLFLVVIAVLSSSIFALSSVSVDYLSTINKITVSNTEIVESANFDYGSSIFFLNKQDYINKIERTSPYVKVVNIETVFPSSLIIHLAERNEVFAINYSGKYYYLDNEGKILCEQENFVNSADNPILLETNAEDFTENVVVGDFISSQQINLLKIFNALSEWNNSSIYLKAHIVKINITSDDLIIEMRSGLIIKLINYNNNFSNKLNLAFSIYDNNDDIKSKSLLEIRTIKNSDGSYSIKGFCS